MPSEAVEGLGGFFDGVWHDTAAFVYLASMEKGQPESFNQYVVEWPKHKDGIIRHVLAESAAGRDVYYSPALYRENRRPTKNNVLGAWVQWADFDKGAPENWSETAQKESIPEPTLRVQSSVKGREHVYWQLDAFQTDVEALEAANRAIAYRLKADTSGWDADQLLRPPCTTNYGYKGGDGTRKPWYQGEPAQVFVSASSYGPLSVSSFAALGTPEKEYLDKITLGDIPGIESVLALAKWTEEFYNVFRMTKEEAAASSPHKRSGALMRLGYLGVEHGLSDEQIYSVLNDADKRWEKYSTRSRAGRNKVFLDTIARARAKHGYITPESLTFAGLMAGQEHAPEGAEQQWIYSFTEFLAHEINIEWLVEGFLTQGGFGIITGQPGVGKTQLGIQLCIDLARGTEKFLKWDNISGQKKVMFLSLEMPHAPLKLFIGKMAQQYEDDIGRLERNMHIAPIGQSLPLETIQGQQFLDAVLKEYLPDILFIDSLQKITGKPLTDEQSAKDLVAYLNKVRSIYGCTIVIVHHNRKKTADGKTTAGDLSEMFGSQFLAAEMDMVLNLRAIGTTGVLSVDCWKNRLAGMWPTFEIQRNENLQYDMFREGGVITIGPDTDDGRPAHLSL